MGDINCWTNYPEACTKIIKAPCWGEENFGAYRRGINFTFFGQVPKWPKGADCKSAAPVLQRFESSPAH